MHLINVKRLAYELPREGRDARRPGDHGPAGAGDRLRQRAAGRSGRRAGAGVLRRRLRAAPPAPAAEAVDFVSEDDVRRALRDGRTIALKAGAIVTPSARDLADGKNVLIPDGRILAPALPESAPRARPAFVLGCAGVSSGSTGMWRLARDASSERLGGRSLPGRAGLRLRPRPGRRAEGARPAPLTPAERTARLIATADAHLARGMDESRQGHLESARQEFNRAVDVYLTAPGGAYSNAAVAEAYRRTLQAVQVQELEVLAAGDGFTETQSEPAAIDDVGDLSLGVHVQRGDPQHRRGGAAPRARRPPRSSSTTPSSPASTSTRGRCASGSRPRSPAAAGTCPASARSSRPKASRRTSPTSRSWRARSTPAPSPAPRRRACGSSSPRPGRRYGLAQDWWVDERSDPDKATRAAARYLRELYEIFGDWNLALASYNAGEGRVSRAMERYGANDFWTLSRVSNLAQETRNYVPMIHAAIIVAKAADRYGFDIAPEPVLTYDAVPVKGAVDLRVIAECAGTGVEHRAVAQPRAAAAGHAGEPHLPGEGARRARGRISTGCLETLPAEKRVAFRTHVVGRGQSLASIAKRYGAKPGEIASANSLGSGKRLARGTELIIPVKAGAARDLAAGTRTAVQSPHPLGRHPARHRPALQHHRGRPHVVEQPHRHPARRRQHPHHLHHSLATRTRARPRHPTLGRRTRALPPLVGGQFRPREIPCWPRR